MNKHYKIVLFSFAIFLFVGLSPIESQHEPVQLVNEVHPIPVEVIPVDLTQVQESDRELWEAVAEYRWAVEQHLAVSE